MQHPNQDQPSPGKAELASVDEMWRGVTESGPGEPDVDPMSQSPAPVLGPQCRL